MSNERLCQAIYYYADGGWSRCVLSSTHLCEHQRHKLAPGTLKEFPGRWVDDTISDAEKRSIIHSRLQPRCKCGWVGDICDNLDEIIQRHLNICPLKK